ncbi:hypothetical protein [uncultured Actinobacillus sp.]|uniref:hypothetical protein n=1 Tax=uncultured Actinobacillus sp. TaxID=417616 RepID=UPI0025D0BDB5|nr:hypothetical protein [uncultured Actinobacillus sp.]
MNNKTPTHCAVSMANMGKIERSIKKAQAILTLVQHNQAEGEGDGFFTSEKIIRTALGVAQDLLEEAEQSSKVAFYFVKEGKNE